ncbi:glycosyl transferase [Mesonia sp. K7]|uniref:glycosyl transferase n=1 Tax=Mesonia sp. K7 TaxID=2218606 RepID=UPI000DA985AB|nr:glycosyl transferase [Mesonia sp. K7]PZD77001.1 glycosyl transferase [Mesonia sp. K7]
MKIFKELLPYLYHKSRLSFYSNKHLKKPHPKKEIPVIVSLTTIPSRLEVVYLTIKSILAQNAKPKKVILNLHKSLKNSIPKNLKNLEGEVFEIHLSEIDCPHLKLVETLKRFPKENIVTIDDDQVYPANFLKTLYHTHLENPNAIISNIARLIKFDKNEEPLPYQKWPYVYAHQISSKFLLPLGVFGVLYPPNSLNEEVFNIEQMNLLAPKADDLWFKAMGLLNDAPVVITKKTLHPITILNTQEITLKRYNVSQDNNRLQWKKLMEVYQIAVK